MKFRVLSEDSIVERTCRETSCLLQGLQYRAVYKGKSRVLYKVRNIGRTFFEVSCPLQDYQYKA